MTAPAVDALDHLRLRVAAGAAPGPVDALPERARRAVEVAAHVGAPLLPAIDAATEAESDIRRASRAVTVATAQTRVVAGGLLLSPMVLLPALGRLFDVDLVAFYRQPLGMAVGVAGVLLLAVGAALIWSLVRRVGRRQTPAKGRAILGVVVGGVLLAYLLHPAVMPAALLLLRRRSAPPVAVEGADEIVDLVAVGLSGGVSVGAALRATADAAGRHAGDCRRLALSLELGGPVPDLPPGLDRLARHLDTATTTGAAVVPSLRRLAADLRADDLARVLAAAERLPAQLTFPTALCLLPAVLLLIGAPILHAGLSAAGT